MPVLSELTLTAEARLLFSTMLPLVVPAPMFAAARFSAVLSPMPVTALKLTVLAVTLPAPSMLPAEVMVYAAPAAVVVPVSRMLPVVKVVRLTF